MLEAMANIFRTFMLIFALKLAGSAYIHPIFVGFCGMVQSLLGVFKTLTKRTFLSLNIKDLKHIHPLQQNLDQTGKLSEVIYYKTDSSEGEESESVSDDEFGKL